MRGANGLGYTQAPRRVARRRDAGITQVLYGGVAMDAEIAALLPILEEQTSGRLALFETQLEEVRRERAALALPTQGTGPEVALQEDRMILGPDEEVPVRIFLPDSPVGAYLHIHGGGWVLGSHTAQDPMLRRIAKEASLAVVSVGYRLAPEHPYPAGLDDCVAASRWLEANAVSLGIRDGEALMIGGESAGANLAVATLLYRRDHMELPFRAAVLTYGVFSAIYDLPSMKAMWDRELVLSGPIMEFFSNAYAPGRNLTHPYISPLYADLKGMPGHFQRGHDGPPVFGHDTDGEGVGGSGRTCRNPRIPGRTARV